ncbi:hypothetical protein [Chelativorans sp. AA-79]|uniref:hypothetical protein n=1 Tax=Chelativorans sp. AA-79 TaxID=3028735 RepID=UPI0023F8F8D3|nr:hypothetical protein [Chelativorans sp. AA-79]WEX07689.1 hypothetical protein PVE73_16445 [Chelativorans sp. AA-79]
MATLTREGVHRILGPVDNALLAEIAAVDCSEQELAEAHAWVMNDEALVNDFRPMPNGRVAELVDILSRRFGPGGEEDMA